MTLTFYQIASESADRASARMFCRHDHLDVARDVWDSLLMSLSGLWMFDLDGNRHASGLQTAASSSFDYHGPGGRITVHVDDTLPPGTWAWREPSPFERWFPTHEGA